MLKFSDSLDDFIQLSEHIESISKDIGDAE